MSEKITFDNPNYIRLEPEADADINIEPKKIEPREGETGIHAVDASNRLHARITDAEKAAENGLVDTLTGCYNRNYYEKYRNENFDPRRDHLKVGLVFADLNGLKIINDTMGHEFGDLLLKKAAKFLREKFRPSDIIVRLGGDEFVVICRNENNEPDFEGILNRRLEKTEENEDKVVDFAFGTAVYDAALDTDTDTNLDGILKHTSLDKTLKRADKLMYEYKEKQKLGLVH